MATMKKAQNGLKTYVEKALQTPTKKSPNKDKKSDIQPIPNEKGNPFKNKNSIIQPLKKGGKMSKKSKK